MSALAGWTAEALAEPDDGSVVARMLEASWHDESSACELRGTMGVRRQAKPASAYCTETLTLAVVGNIYWKDRKLAALATARGDAAAVADSFSRDGEHFLRGMQGSFALALRDSRNGVAYLAIDPMGIERLCYTVASGRLVFASSVQALRAHPAVRATISPQAIFSYLYHHVIPAPLTIYDGIWKLQPGELLRFHDGHTEISRYWQLHFEDHAGSPVQRLVDEFHQILHDSVARPLDQFANVGAFLSGGTDSSCVTAAVAQARGAARTFSIGFDAEGYDESGYARITADRFRTDHHHYYVTPDDVGAALPLVAAYYDEPFGNASAVPAYICARLARASGVQNMLAGDGGDEIFGGNERYLKQKIFEYWQLIPAPLRSGLVMPLARRFPFGARIAPVRKLRSYIEQARIPLPDRLETYNFLHREPLERMFDPRFLREVDTTAPLRAQRAVYAAADCASTLNRMLFLDMKYTLADNDLRKVEGMCELAGINVHYPLIDIDMVNFAARVPVDMKIKGHQLRWFFKHALKGTLAPETLRKSKHGFGLPFGLWLNEHPGLHGIAGECMESFKSRGYLDPRYIDALRVKHREGHSPYYGTMIWICVMMEQWLQAHA